MKINHKHTHTPCKKYCLYVKNYKHGDRPKLWGYIWQFNADRICTYKFFTKQWNSRSRNLSRRKTGVMNSAQDFLFGFTSQKLVVSVVNWLGNTNTNIYLSVFRQRNNFTTIKNVNKFEHIVKCIGLFTCVLFHFISQHVSIFLTSSSGDCLEYNAVSYWISANYNIY
jgi:hypothetical protein